MPFENTHFGAVWLLCIVVFIVFEEDIVEETFGVKCHLVANNIKAGISFTKWELLTTKRSANHANCIASLTVFICCFGVA